MDIQLTALIIIVLATGFYLFRGVRIASENERFAIQILGKYSGLKGPGVLIKWSGPEIAWKKLALGDEGEYLGDGLAQFDQTGLPVKGGDLKIGHSVRITSFRENNIWVTDNGPAKKTVICEKCGHKMRV